MFVQMFSERLHAHILSEKRLLPFIKHFQNPTDIRKCTVIQLNTRLLLSARKLVIFETQFSSDSCNLLIRVSSCLLLCGYTYSTETHTHTHCVCVKLAGTLTEQQVGQWCSCFMRGMFTLLKHIEYSVQILCSRRLRQRSLHHLLSHCS